jgi:hypothetical protein
MDRLPLRMEQFGDQTGPTRLMRRTDAPSGVAVEILVEQQVISEIRVSLQPWILDDERQAGRSYPT